MPNSSNSPDNSIVLIENGVSGKATVNDPFLNKTTNIEIEYIPLDTGSGFIITSDGYIVTAFHVLADQDTMEKQQVLKKMNESEIKRIVEKSVLSVYLSKYNPQLTDELLKNNSMGKNYSLNDDDLADLLEKKRLIVINSYEQVIKVKFPSSLNINPENSLNAKLVDIGDPGSYEDIALLKVDPLNNTLPALAIKSKEAVNGDHVFIYGYPGVGSQYNNRQPINPSSTSGALTSKQITSGGVTYYQCTAPTKTGYSGGPVLDDKNKVIGILIFSNESINPFKQIESKSSIFLSSKYIVNISKNHNVTLISS